MAHDEKIITKTRTVLIENLLSHHDREGHHFGADAVIEARGGHFFALRDGVTRGAFHLRQAFHNSERGTFNPLSGDVHGAIYRPIAEGTTEEDVEGATFAWDDGTAWHFAHCSPDEQVDLAAVVRTFTVAQFTDAIHKAQVKVFEATNAPVRAAAVGKVRALVAFAAAAGADAYQRVTGATLGHFHRDAHHDHRRDLAIAAVAAVLADWDTRGKTDKAVRGDAAHVRTAAAAVSSALGTTHTIEWRAARAKRLKAAAEKAAAEAAAETEPAPAEDAEG